MNGDHKNGLNPYIGGALTGLLIILSVAVSGNYFGTSTSIVQLLGMLEKFISPFQVAQTEYFKVVNPVISWQILFVTGIFIGGFLGATLFGEFKWRFFPDLWKNHLGTSYVKRGLFAFLGGMIAMIGARLAGGCPSGQMSAMILLSLSALVAMIMFFAAGIITVKLVYKGGGK
ncbi:MAG TPA: YeeE/YedE thiosulfate transporter family protein [Syntrophomonas sp.]|nr:YeeE/YedE thiosulfate transporter family protein [Syntrophomonas sp.]HRW13391.1 YeeE/YedE thiosulfate transporter family protein [Syntrophomonas sp.]